MGIHPVSQKATRGVSEAQAWLRPSAEKSSPLPRSTKDRAGARTSWPIRSRRTRVPEGTPAIPGPGKVYEKPPVTVEREKVLLQEPMRCQGESASASSSTNPERGRGGGTNSNSESGAVTCGPPMRDAAEAGPGPPEPIRRRARSAARAAARTYKKRDGRALSWPCCPGGANWKRRACADMLRKRSALPGLDRAIPRGCRRPRRGGPRPGAPPRATSTRPWRPTSTCWWSSVVPPARPSVRSRAAAAQRDGNEAGTEEGPGAPGWTRGRRGTGGWGTWAPFPTLPSAARDGLESKGCQRATLER